MAALNIQIARPGLPTDLSTVMGVKLIRVTCQEGAGSVPTWAYEWYRAETSDFGAATAIGITFDPAYDDVDVEVGTEYHYWVAALSDLAAVTRSAPAGPVSAMGQGEESLQIYTTWYRQGLLLPYDSSGYDVGYGGYVTPTDGANEFLVNDVLMNGQPVKFVLDCTAEWTQGVSSHDDDFAEVAARLRVVDMDDLSEPPKDYYSRSISGYETPPQSTSGTPTPNIWNDFFYESSISIILQDGHTAPWVDLRWFKGIVGLPDDVTIDGLEVTLSVGATISAPGSLVRCVLYAADGTASDPLEVALAASGSADITFGGAGETWGLDAGDLVGEQWNTNAVKLRITVVNNSGADLGLTLHFEDAVRLKPHFSPAFPKVIYERSIPMYGLISWDQVPGGYFFDVDWGSKLFSLYYDFEPDELPPAGHTAQFRIDFTVSDQAYPNTVAGAVDLSDGTLKIRQRG